MQGTSSIAALASRIRRNGGALSPPTRTDVNMRFRDTNAQARAGQRPYWQTGFTLDEVQAWEQEQHRTYDGDRYSRMLRRERRGILECVAASMLPASAAYSANRKGHQMYNEEKEQVRAVYAERATRVGMSLVSYCKAFRVRGVLYKHEQGGVIL